MESNVEKYYRLQIDSHNLLFGYDMGGRLLKLLEKKKSLVIVVDTVMKPSHQCIEAKNKTNRLLVFISKSIKCKSKDVIMKWHNSLVRPHLEYCSQTLTPVFAVRYSLTGKDTKESKKDGFALITLAL